MSFIENKTEFEKVKKNLFTKIDKKKNFESNPFLLKFKYFRAFDFDFLFEYSFINSIKKETKLDNQIEYYFYVLKPDPLEYFYKHFGKFNVFKFPAQFNEIEFDNILMKDPGDSPSDAIAINSFEIAFYPSSGNWCILASRDLEIAIIGFSKLDYIEKFEKCFDNYQDIFYSVENYVSYLFDILEMNESQKVIYKNIVHNYK